MQLRSGPWKVHDTYSDKPWIKKYQTESISTKFATRLNFNRRRTSERCREKYHRNNHIFVPFAVETLGPICWESSHFITETAKKNLRRKGWTPREFLFQRISVAVQRYDAACVTGFIIMKEVVIFTLIRKFSAQEGCRNYLLFQRISHNLSIKSATWTDRSFVAVIILL